LFIFGKYLVKLHLFKAEAHYHCVCCCSGKLRDEFPGSWSPWNRKTFHFWIFLLETCSLI